MFPYSPEHYVFGKLLCFYRSRMPGGRSSQQWLADKLHYSKYLVCKWESGNLSAPLPRREIILDIGRWYSLSCEEVNELLSAATTTASARGNRKAGTYTQLKPEEVAGWKVVIGPSRSSMATWQETLALAKKARRAGELHTTRNASALLLEQLELSSEDPEMSVLWSRAERLELDGLWVEGWYEFYQAAAHLETTASLVRITAPYFERAHERLMQPGILLEQRNLVTANLAGMKHIIKDYRQASFWHRALMWGVTSDRIDQDRYSLQAQTLRLIILDAPYTPWKVALMSDIRQGRHLADKATSEHLRERIMLLEAIGRTLAIMQNPQCWAVLDKAITEARGRDPLAYVSALYSYLVAEFAYPRTGRVNQDAVLARGREALVIADTFGWKRRSWQIKQAARRCGVSLE